MCGIAGVVYTDQAAKASVATVHAMCETIVHRGPDDEGAYAAGPAGLGMRRLSIIDLVTGEQPMFNEDRTIWVVFNGEIYNFRELRNELAAEHQFSTRSDTEVIVHAYEQWGTKCVRKLRGMFAIALYDSQRQKLVLARDRFGKKPLHYTLYHGQFLFASEIKALLAAAPELAEVDQNALLHYFYFGYIPDPSTAFTRIKKVPAGHVLELEAGQVKLWSYWELPSFAERNPVSEDECLQQLESLLGDAVRMRLISDVPLGALLSGGVDSSLVVALMARASSSPVKTFSIGFPHQDFDEARYARMVAEQFGTDHHELKVEPNLGETLELLTRHLEEPFADASMVPTYHVCRMARQHVTVALSGDGGDELFAGYDRYAVHLKRADKLAWFSKMGGTLYRDLVYPLLPSGTRGRKLLYNLSLKDEERYLDSVAHLPVLDRERSVFSREYLAWAKSQQSPFEVFRQYLLSAPAGDALSRIQYLDTKTYLVGDILTKVDRMSMLTSLEVRVPLLDHVAAEWVASLSSGLKMKDGEPKHILKKLAERVGVPAEVLYRPKQGFAMPLVHWMRGTLKRELLDVVIESRTLQRGYFSPRAIRTMIEEHWDGRRDHSAELWQLLIFELWHRNFLEARKGDLASTLPPHEVMASASLAGS